MRKLAQSPGFITHHELDKLAGTARTRQRWRERGILPEPAWVRADRARLGLLPEFVLGSVMLGAAGTVPRRTDGDGDLLRCACHLAQELFSTESFHEIAAAAQKVLAEADAARSPWDLANFVVQLAGRAASSLGEWRSEVARAEQELEAKGFRVSRVAAEVHVVDHDEVVVDADGGSVRYPVQQLGWVPKVGRSVIVDRIEVGARGRDFLLPSLLVDMPGELEGNPMTAALHPELRTASHLSPSTVVAMSPVSGRLDALVGRPLMALAGFNVGRQVNWREQFNRGYMGQDLSADPPIRKVGDLEIYSRKLDRPIFR